MGQKLLDDHLDKLLVTALVFVFIISLLAAIHWDASNTRLLDVLEGGLQYVLGIFSALMLPGGISLIKGLTNKT